eukprot:2782239-Prymnesium_polylepis.2
MVYMTRGGHVLAQDQLPGSPRYHSCRLCSGVLQMGFGLHAEHAVVAHTHSCFRPLQNCGQCEECWAEVHHRSVDMLAERGVLFAARSLEGRWIIRDRPTSGTRALCSQAEHLRVSDQGEAAGFRPAPKAQGRCGA